MELNLGGKTGLVTGGAYGLGEAICASLAAEGVNVALNYRRRPEMAEALAETIRGTHGVKAVPVAGDITKESDVVALFDETETALSSVDILVNNAGVCPISSVHDMSEEEWTHTLQVNLTGTFLTSREMVRRCLKANRPGRILNVVSPAAFLGSSSGKSHYAASKAGVVAFTLSLAREVAQNGITVNAVAPGMMLTEMTTEFLEEHRERYEQQIPLGRLGESPEIADVITFMVSGRAAYMTGATVDVSGGLLMR